jgi:hypothetical protein
VATAIAAAADVTIAVQGATAATATIAGREAKDAAIADLGATAKAANAKAATKAPRPSSHRRS